MVTNLERALIIKKIHLDKIFDKGKVWEMRSTKTSIRGRVGLIQSGSGLIVGEVNIIGCFEPPMLLAIADSYKFHYVDDLELLTKWKYAWVLSEARRYDNPVPYKHPRGAVIWVKLNK